MNLIARCIAVGAMCIVMTTSATAQDKVNEQIIKELAELRAELKALKAKIAKLEGEDGRLVPTISEHEKKWIRNVTVDFMTEMIKMNPWAAEKFVQKGLELRRGALDPNVIVKFQSTYQGKTTQTTGPRVVGIYSVFEKFKIESETVSPSKDEFLIQGILDGNRTNLHPDENREGNVEISTTVVEGKLGKRTGSFTLRFACEKDTNRWLISYFRWSVDEIKKDVEKK